MEHLFRFSLLLLALLLPATALAYDFEVDGIYYNSNGTKATVTSSPSSNIYTGDVTIPATVTYGGTTYSVTFIGDYAFYNCNGLTSITIPNSVTSIGEGAFSGCSGLTNVTIGNSVTSIGYEAFAYCSGLTSIDIPNSVTSIGEGTFYGCTGLTSINIPNSVTDLNGWMFVDCTSLTSVTIPNSVTSIGYAAFYGCSSLINIDIPNSVTSIGEDAFYNTAWYDNQPDGLVYAGLVAYKYKGTMPTGTSLALAEGTLGIAGGAFYGCSGLTSIDIPNSATSIGNDAFYNTAWYNNQPDGLVYAGLVAYKYKGTMPNGTSITLRDGTLGIAGGAFSYCFGLTSITIPNSVRIISDEAFFYCFVLTSIDIPNSVRIISDKAFSHCTGLNSITIPNSVKIISDETFYGCTGLTSITIPNSVTSIGNSAFNNCSGLTEIYCLSLTPPTIDSYEFSGCYGASLYVPHYAVESYQSAEGWKDFSNITDVTFREDNINYRVLDENSASVMVNNDEVELYSGELVIPDSASFKEIYPFKVTGIERNAFDGCYELTSITIPNSVEAIGEQAFQGCTGLTSVIIGSGVTAIGSKAFNYCNALETVKCIGTVPPVMASADCFSTAAYNRATLLVPRNSEATYAAADYWYKFAHIDGWGSAGRGDVNGDGIMNIADVTFLIDAMLRGDHEGVYFESADLNSNGRLDIGDVTSLIDDLFYGN